MIRITTYQKCINNIKCLQYNNYLPTDVVNKSVTSITTESAPKQISKNTPT
jgi:hypothetical protein